MVPLMDREIYTHTQNRGEEKEMMEKVGRSYCKSQPKLKYEYHNAFFISICSGSVLEEDVYFVFVPPFDVQEKAPQATGLQRTALTFSHSDLKAFLPK